MEAYGTSVGRKSFSSAAIVIAAVIGMNFIVRGQLTEGFMAVTVGLLAYSAVHEQKPYFT